MFNSNLIMAVKVNGKVLREFDGTVALPFGSEYSIYLKNTSSKRASVDITIDGQDALDGTSIIVNANSQVEVKRFIKNGNFDAGNAFKFIEKTRKIEEFRGNKAEDGLLTVTYSFEREQPYQQFPYISDYASLTRSISGSLCATSYTNMVVPSSLSSSATTTSTTLPLNNSGITAPGSEVKQQFSRVYGFTPDGKVHTMTLKMIGAHGEVEVTAPVTVKRKVRCTTCGTYCKQTAKFCHECSASVVII